LQPFVVTLCGLLLYRGIAAYYTNDGTAGFAFGQSFPTLEWLTTGRSFGVPHTFIAFVLIALAMAVLLHRSVFGRHLFVRSGATRKRAHSGIQTGRVVATAYVLWRRAGGSFLDISHHVHRARFRRPRTEIFTSLYGIARRCWAAARCAVARDRSSGIVLGTILLQILQKSRETCWELRVPSISR